MTALSPSDRDMLLEKSARLRCMCDALWHDVMRRLGQPDYPESMLEENKARQHRWIEEARGMEARCQ